MKPTTSNKPELVNGIFTVNNNGKKVKFAKGNLFWNGKEFCCEKNQYDYPKRWNKNHIGHFFWSKDTSVVTASEYPFPTENINDKFFASNGRVIEGYTVLSKDEWDYLFSNALAKNSSGKNIIIIAGIKCIVLKPDGFSGTVADLYTADEWAKAENKFGLVALPFAGYRSVTSFYSGGSGGYYWSGTPYSDGADSAYYAYFASSAAYTGWNIRYDGRSVRLVSVQDIPVTENPNPETKKAKQFNLSAKESEFNVVSINNAQEAVDYARQFYGDDITIYESAFIILLNAQSKTIGWAKISQGGCSATILDVKLICKYAVESLASGVILIHNHPSGDANPSYADTKETEQLKDALKLFDVLLLDHIILTDDKYYSFSEN